jgi:hypothetical protein
MAIHFIYFNVGIIIKELIMLREIDNWYFNKEEPYKSCYEALRSWILNCDNDITEAWRYRLPMFLYKGKMFCYLHATKKTEQPYIGIVNGGKIDHPALFQGTRKRMKVLYIDPLEDLPISFLEEILMEAKTFYK